MCKNQLSPAIKQQRSTAAPPCQAQSANRRVPAQWAATIHCSVQQMTAQQPQHASCLARGKQQRTTAPTHAQNSNCVECMLHGQHTNGKTCADTWKCQRKSNAKGLSSCPAYSSAGGTATKLHHAHTDAQRHASSMSKLQQNCGTPRGLCSMTPV